MLRLATGLQGRKKISKQCRPKAGSVTPNPRQVGSVSPQTAGNHLRELGGWAREGSEETQICTPFEIGIFFFSIFTCYLCVCKMSK